jgi:tetratricopeptide (TPR) repeat protein
MRPSSHWNALAAIACLLLSAAPARALEPVWSHLPAGVAADSLRPALMRLESRGPRALAASAAFTLGQFHHARGEYRLAAEAFGRAAARLTGEERADARYHQGLALLGAQDAGHARAAFEDAASSSTLLRAFAQLGLAQAHALAGETSRETEVLRKLLDGPAGEAEPAALERYAALCDKLDRPSEATAARERLLRRWPRSFEAARLGPQPLRVTP